MGNNDNIPSIDGLIRRIIPFLSEHNNVSGIWTRFFEAVVQRFSQYTHIYKD